MQELFGSKRARMWAAAAAVLCAAVLLRQVLREVAIQLAAAYAVMGLGLPLCRRLEKRLSPGAAAGLSLAMLGVGAGALLVGLLPPLANQFAQLSDSLPGLMRDGEKLLGEAENWLAGKGVDVLPVREELITKLQSGVTDALAGAAGAVQRAAASAGKLLLAPLFAYYLLRDRRCISTRLTLLLPVRCRARAVRAAREMRRETIGFLRGQLLVSASVGALTAAGLLLVGLPGWLLLGVLMGVLELVPYVGPLIAGVPTVLLALPGGWTKTLWTLAVVVGVQQLEGGLISPRVMAGAVDLHPLLVLLAISVGGMVAGTPGMLLALPAVVSVRGALRGAAR